MPATFSRTLRSLEADRSHRFTGSLLVTLVILAAWLAWFLLAEVSVYEVTDEARLEVESAAHPLAASVGGQVVATRLELGREVRCGEVIVELDAGRERLVLAEVRAAGQGTEQRLSALRARIDAEKAARSGMRKARRVAIEVARAKVAAAEAEGGWAEGQVSRLEALRAEGAVSGQALTKARSDAASSAATVSSLRLAAEQLEEELRAYELEGVSVLATLESQRVELEVLAQEQSAMIPRLEREIDLRSIRAPISGRIERAAELRVGMVLQEAQVLGSIVPRGRPRVVAWFPAAAVGRIRAGQEARLRMHGFPWTRFGMPRAKVEEVGSESTEGRVRVELAIDLDSAPAIPLEHGLSGAVEVEVERLSPAEVVVRAAGRVLAPRRN